MLLLARFLADAMEPMMQQGRDSQHSTQRDETASQAHLNPTLHAAMPRKLHNVLDRNRLDILDMPYLQDPFGATAHTHHRHSY
jgi:hypothetical protein